MMVNFKPRGPDPLPGNQQVILNQLASLDLTSPTLARLQITQQKDYSLSKEPTVG